MGKSYLKQLLTYINKVYHIGEKINTLLDKRVKSNIKISTITFIVLFGFMLQIRSFNILEHWLKKNKFKKVVPSKTKMPFIDTIRRCLSDFDLQGLKNIDKSIVKTTIKNKVFRGGTIDGFKVAAIDGVELFESTKKHCEKCLSRTTKDGKIHYFHRSVICATVGSDPHIILGQEMLEPKKDSSKKDEGELTGGKRLMKNLYKQYHHFADIIVADALYCTSPWIKQVLSLKMDAVVRVKNENLDIVKNALGIFKCRKADNQWIIRKNKTNYRVIEVWDDKNFEMPDSSIKVRFVRFKEEIHSKDKPRTQEGWIITTNEFISVKTLNKIMHKRWDIENNIFHQLKTEWHFDHCFVHNSSYSVETVVIFMIIAFNLMQLYFFRCIRGFRKKKMLQINVIEDIKDERFTIEENWTNPLLGKT